jgi:ATP-dependent RNA helicase DeaD
MINFRIKQLNFNNIALKSEFISLVSSLRYNQPTPIQSNIIPCILRGGDVLGQAQTGTGKTASFVIPLLTKINLKSRQSLPQVLILTPTRELSIQVASIFSDFSKNFSGLEVLAIYGGSDYRRQIIHLRRGVHILVGTTGRIMDHMKRGTLKLDNLLALVLDEADEMLRMGFIEDVKWILSHVPDICQRLLFSATFPKEMISIVNKYFRTPIRIIIKTKIATANAIQQYFILIRKLKKLDVLNRILEHENIDGAIIFVKTKSLTIEIADYLKNHGNVAAAINGDMQQSLRESIIFQFKSKKINIIVATDVVARGLDINRISHIINYDLPQNKESYIHRIGRTGRAGRKGSAISLVYPQDIKLIRTLEYAINCNIKEMHVPSSVKLTQSRIVNFKEKLSKIIRGHNLSVFNNVIKDFEISLNAKKDDIMIALLYLVHEKENLFIVDNTYKSYRKLSHNFIYDDKKS